LLTATMSLSKLAKCLEHSEPPILVSGNT
jgi:hypothetical protein